MILLIDSIDVHDYTHDNYSNIFYEGLLSILKEEDIEIKYAYAELMDLTNGKAINSAIDILETHLDAANNNDDTSYTFNFGIVTMLILCDKYKLKDQSKRLHNIIGSKYFNNVKSFLIFEKKTDVNLELHAKITKTIQYIYSNLNDDASDNKIFIFNYGQNNETKPYKNDLDGEFKFIVSNILKINK